MKNIITVMMLLAVTGMLTAQTPIPKENLISYWTGEPNPGTGHRLDEIGSNHLWDCPESSVTVGKIGNATVFDGNGHLRTKLRTDTYASGIQTDGREISYAGWVQVDGLGSDQIICSRWSRWAPARSHRLYYDASAGAVKLDWSDSANTSVQTVADDLTISGDTWYFIAFGRSDAAAEVWLTVTPETETAPRTAVTLSSVPTNPDGDAGELWFYYDQGSKNDCYGRWDEWAVYNKTLDSDEIVWLFNNGSGRTYTDFSYVEEPVLEFFHDMEQEEPARGRISYYSFSENAALSTEHAASGSQSLKITGDWGQIQLFNDTNTDYWCPIDKCRVSMDIYMVDFLGSMLFQLDGKTSSVLTDLDTNEGIGKVMFSNNGGQRGFSVGSAETSGYNLPLNQWVHIDYLRDRHRTAPGNNMELYADGVLILSTQGEDAPYTPPPFVAQAWHHISLGNDIASAPTFYIDNFEVAPDPWGSALSIRPMSSLTAVVGEALSITPVVTGAGDAAEYEWILTSGPDSVDILAPDAVNTDVVFSGPGTYALQLTVTDTADTASATVSVEVMPPSGIRRPAGDIAAFSAILPSNPVSGQVRFAINGIKGVKAITIYDRTGRTMTESTTGYWNGMDHNGASAPTGTYFYRIVTETGEATGSFIKVE